MITYPSTYGVLDADVREICDQVHAAGAGLHRRRQPERPAGAGPLGEFGGDVSHINLHKTFAILHGGGGPGVGPVVSLNTWRPRPVTPTPRRRRIASRWRPPCTGRPGYADSWAFIAMTGGDGLRACAENALLSANWLANQLDDAFPVLYRGGERAGGSRVHPRCACRQARHRGLCRGRRQTPRRLRVPRPDAVLSRCTRR